MCRKPWLWAGPVGISFPIPYLQETIEKVEFLEEAIPHKKFLQVQLFKLSNTDLRALLWCVCPITPEV